MMEVLQLGKDPLDRETTLSAELTEKGVTAKSNSRAVNAFDRLLGNAADWVNVRLEGDTVIRRATTDAKKLLIEAASKHGIKRLSADPEFAERALASHLGAAYRRQANKDAVVKEAAEDLQVEPPTKEQANSNPEQIEEVFLDRFEHYAEFASTDELRTRWGRVLAAEVRKPGTFSAKVLRIIDEIDGTTAREFESLCENRLGGIVPLVLSGEVMHDTRTRLVVAGLLVEPGFVGKVVQIPKAKLNDSTEVFFCSLLPGFALSVPVDAPLKDNSVLARQSEVLTLKVSILTEAGEAISSILADRQQVSYRRLIDAIADIVSPSAVTQYAAFGDEFRAVGKVQK
jgi:hypothetical protein